MIMVFSTKNNYQHVSISDSGHDDNDDKILTRVKLASRAFRVGMIDRLRDIPAFNLTVFIFLVHH